MRRLIIGIILVVALIAVGMAVVSGNANKNAMNSGSMPPSSMAPANSQPVAKNSVTIQNFAFNEPHIVVHKGDTVTWTNQDDAHHSINISQGPEKSEGPLLAKGETYSKTFTVAGTYHYHCTPHPYMEATVEVQS